MTSMEALETIKNYHDETVFELGYTYTENVFEREIDQIREDLEILQIIKKKRVDFPLLLLEKCADADYYNFCPVITVENRLSSSEFDKLKEWIND